MNNISWKKHIIELSGGASSTPLSPGEKQKLKNFTKED